MSVLQLNLMTLKQSKKPIGKTLKKFVDENKIVSPPSLLVGNQHIKVFCKKQINN